MSASSDPPDRAAYVDAEDGQKSFYGSDDDVSIHFNTSNDELTIENEDTGETFSFTSDGSMDFGGDIDLGGNAINGIGSIDLEGVGSDTVITLDNNQDIIFEDNENSNILEIREDDEIKLEFDTVIDNASFYKGLDTNDNQIQLLGVTASNVALIGDVAGNGIKTEIQANGSTVMDAEVSGNANFDNGNIRVNSDDNYVEWGDDQDVSMGYESDPDALVVDGKDVLLSSGIGLGYPSDSGAQTLVDMDVTSTPADETEQSYSFAVGGTDIVKVFAQADGTGGIQDGGLMFPDDTHARIFTSGAGGSGDITFVDRSDDSPIAQFNEGNPGSFTLLQEGIFEILMGQGDDREFRIDPSNDITTIDAIATAAGQDHAVEFRTASNGTESKALEITSSGDVQFEAGNGLTYTDDAGAQTLVDMNVTDSPADETEQSYSFAVGGTDIVKVFAQADGTGGIEDAGLRFPSSSFSELQTAGGGTDTIGVRDINNDQLIAEFEEGGTPGLALRNGCTVLFDHGAEFFRIEPQDGESATRLTAEHTGSGDHEIQVYTSNGGTESQAAVFPSTGGLDVTGPLTADTISIDEGGSSDTALTSVAATGQTTLSSGTATVDTGLSATDATFYLALGIDDPGADAKVTGRLFWDDSAGTYKIEIVEDGTSVGNPTVNYDVLRVR